MRLKLEIFLEIESGVASNAAVSHLVSELREASCYRYEDYGDSEGIYIGRAEILGFNYVEFKE